MAEIKVYCDGGARGNPGPAAAAFVSFSTEGKPLKKEGEFLGRKTNNLAEYNAVLMALRWLVKEKRKEDVSIFLDSQLITNQLIGRFKIKDQKLKKLATEIKKLEKALPGVVRYYNIPRAKNKIADLLVNKILDATA